jgi:putative RecB family exonuclease
MFIETLSESKSKTFNQCSLKYKYKYVDKIKEDESDKDYLTFGSYIHKIFELGYKEKDERNLLVIAEEQKKNYKFDDKFDKGTEKCIKNFLRFNSSLGETLCTEFPYEIEEQNDIKLNGVIDRVVKGTAGGLLVIDYKTSRTEQTELELFKDHQLQGYVYACSKKFNVPYTSIVASHYYPLTNNFVKVRFTNQQIVKYRNDKIQEVWKIRKMKINECVAKENRFCNWCGYKSMCPLYVSQDVISQKLEEKKNQRSK